MSSESETHVGTAGPVGQDAFKRLLHTVRGQLLIAMILGGCLLTLAWVGFLLWLPIHAVGLW